MRIDIKKVHRPLLVLFGLLLFASALERNLKVIRPDTSTPRRASLQTGIGSQPTTGEAFPDLALVRTTRQNLIRLNDRISGSEERRSARLELHAVEDELDEEGVAVLGDGSAASDNRLMVKIVGVEMRRLRREE